MFLNYILFINEIHIYTLEINFIDERINYYNYSVFEDKFQNSNHSPL